MAGSVQTIIIPPHGNRRVAVWAPWLRENADCQSDGQGGGLSLHQPAAEHVDGQVVRRVSETGRCCVLAGREAAAVDHLHRRDR